MPLSVFIDPAWVASFVLIATRLAGLLLLSPVLGFSVIPPIVRVAFVWTLAFLFASLPETQPYHGNFSLFGLGLAVVIEFLLGAALAFGLHAAIAAFSFAGQLIDFQVGFSAAALFDPNTQVQNPVVSVTLGLLGSAVFLTLDAHLELIRGIAQSLNAIPPGSFITGFNIAAMIAEFGSIFIYGMVLASPVILGLMLVDIAIAVIARTMPQINIYFVSLPLKIFVGLLLLTLSLQHVAPFVRTVIGNVFDYWRAL